MDVLRDLKLKMEVKKSNKLISFPIDDEELLEKYKTLWTKIDGLKNIELNVLPVYDDRCIQPKIRT